MSVFHSVPGVPRGKMERFGGAQPAFHLWLQAIPMVYKAS